MCLLLSFVLQDGILPSTLPLCFHSVWGRHSWFRIKNRHCICITICDHVNNSRGCVWYLSPLQSPLFFLWAGEWGEMKRKHREAVLLIPLQPAHSDFLFPYCMFWLLLDWRILWREERYGTLRWRSFNVTQSRHLGIWCTTRNVKFGVRVGVG